MASVPFHYLDIRAFCYATEDPVRVEAAVGTLLPPDVELDREQSSGHHGDPITVLSTRIETADEMRSVLDQILTMDTIEAVRGALAERIAEDCSFFMRIDKQRAYEGEVVLGPGIQIRGKVEAYPAKRENAISNLDEYLTEGETD